MSDEMVHPMKKRKQTSGIVSEIPVQKEIRNK